MESTGSTSHPSPPYYNDASIFPAWQYPASVPSDFQEPPVHVPQPSIAMGAPSTQTISSQYMPNPEGVIHSQQSAYPQSSSDNEARSNTSPRITGRKKAIDRNRRPCGACSSSKRKCKIISMSPHLCERCKAHGMAECPPHISWTARRRTSTNDSLSPMEGDDRDASSRSVSPPFYTPGRSPTLYSAPGEYYEGLGNTPGTQTWNQPEAEVPSTVHASSLDSYVQPPSLVISQYPQQLDMQPTSIFDLRNLVCHVCHSPYDINQLPFNLVMPVAPSSSSAGLQQMNTYDPNASQRYQ